MQKLVELPSSNPTRPYQRTALSTDRVIRSKPGPRQASPADRKVFRKRITWTRELALAMLVDTTAAVRDRALEGIGHWHLKPGTRRKLRTLFGSPISPPNLLASNMTTRLEAGCWFVAWLLEMQGAHPERQFYHATFIDDRQRTKDLDTTIDLAAVGKPVRALLREHGIDDWFAVIEFQPYANWQRNFGRDLAPHLHVIFWTDRPIDHRDLARQMQGSRRLTSLTAAPTVTIVHRQGVGEIAHMAAYLFKGPERAANLVGAEYRRSGKAGTYDAYMRPDLAVRLMEILSHFRLTELILSSGEGKAARSALIAELHLLRIGRFPQQELDREAAPGIWRRARSQAHKEQYSPVQVQRPAERSTQPR